MSEPLGALFGYCVLGGDVGNVAYGAMFAIVAGMMVYISLAELLPSAHRFDSNGGVIMGSMVALILPPLFASSSLTFEPLHAAIKIIFSLSYCWQSTDTTCAHVLLPRRRLWARVTCLSLVSHMSFSRLSVCDGLWAGGWYGYHGLVLDGISTLTNLEVSINILSILAPCVKVFHLRPALVYEVTSNNILEDWLKAL
jgi:hypothetical protein